MTVWKNDVKLGVMLAEGLSGPLCWLGGRGGPAGPQRVPRVRAGARVANGGGADSSTPKLHGEAAHRDRHRVRTGGCMAR